MALVQVTGFGGGVEEETGFGGGVEDDTTVVVHVLMGIGTVSVAPASRMMVEAQQDGCGGFGGM